MLVCITTYSLDFFLFIISHVIFKYAPETSLFLIFTFGIKGTLLEKEFGVILDSSTHPSRNTDLDKQNPSRASAYVHGLPCRLQLFCVNS